MRGEAKELARLRVWLSCGCWHERCSLPGMRRLPLIPTATAAIALAAAAVFAQQAMSRSALTVQQVMQMTIVPSSDAVFAAASEPPKTTAQWTAVRAAAATLRDSGKLLMTGVRARDKAGWMTMARKEVDAAQAVMKAAEAKDADALSSAGDALYETCESCHARYLLPAAPAAK